MMGINIFIILQHFLRVPCGAMWCWARVSSVSTSPRQISPRCVGGWLVCRWWTWVL